MKVKVGSLWSVRILALEAGRDKSPFEKSSPDLPSRVFRR